MFQRQKDNGPKFTWLIFTVCSCLLAGISNFLIGDLSSKYGYSGIFPATIGQAIIFFSYHSM